MKFLNGEVKSLNADWGLFVGHALGVTSRHELKANDDWIWLSTVQTAIRELEPARPRKSLKILQLRRCYVDYSLRFSSSIMLGQCYSIGGK